MSSQPNIDTLDPTVDLDSISLGSWNMSHNLSSVSGALGDVFTVTADPNGHPGYLYTTAITGGGTGINDVAWTSPSPTLKLNGKDADIEINGVSLTETLKGLQDRLNILRPNVDLESRWDELRQVRERYQRLEQEILEKERAWNALQQRG